MTILQAALIAFLALPFFSGAEASASDFEETLNWEYIESRTGNHCRDQTENFLYNIFGEEFQIHKVTKIKHSGGASYYEFWVKSSFCSNYIVAETIQKPGCSTAHYGFVPVYIRRVWFRGDCREISRRDMYPNRETIRQPNWLD